MGGLVVLPGEVGEVLPAGGEHDAVDLRPAPWPASATSWLTLASRDPRPPTVHCSAASGPTRARSRLKCQVPSVPVLDVDEPELGPAADEDLDGPGVQRRGIAPVAPGGLADERRLGPFLEHDQRVVHVDPPLAGQADQAEQRGLDLDALGHVEQRPAGPERRVQGREGVGRRRRRPRSAGSARAARDAP